jgi:hypothetical protein
MSDDPDFEQRAGEHVNELDNMNPGDVLDSENSGDSHEDPDNPDDVPVCASTKLDAHGEACTRFPDPKSTRNYCTYHENRMCPHNGWKGVCEQCRVTKRDVSPRRVRRAPGVSGVPGQSTCKFRHANGEKCTFEVDQPGTVCGKHIRNTCNHGNNKAICPLCKPSGEPAVACRFAYMNGDPCQNPVDVNSGKGDVCHRHMHALCALHRRNRNTCIKCHPSLRNPDKIVVPAPQAVPAPAPTGLRAEFVNSVFTKSKYQEKYIQFLEHKLSYNK